MNTDSFDRCPSVLDPENYSYRERHLRCPRIEEDEEIVFDEPGRVLPPLRSGRGVDCRSHYFRVTKPEFGKYQLRVHHGSGEECWGLDYDDRTVHALGQLDSDSRYRLLWVIMNAHHESEAKGENKYRQYFLEGRLKKRREKGAAYVEVLPKKQES